MKNSMSKDFKLFKAIRKRIIVVIKQISKQANNQAELNRAGVKLIYSTRPITLGVVTAIR